MNDPKRPNIIWIFPDEWRHDALGYAGNPVVRTPNLDRLAARGTAFLDAYCESPVCQPSRASLLTCRFPSQHGKTQNGADPDEPVARRLMPAGRFPAASSDNILHRLRASGYRTSAVGKMHFEWSPHQAAGYRAAGERTEPADTRTPIESGLAAFGFDDVAEEHDKHVLMLDSVETPYTRYLAERGLLLKWREHVAEQVEIMFGRDRAGRPAIPDALEADDVLDAFIGRQVCEQVERLAMQEQPFFLWAGFVGPHPPFDGPLSFADAFDPMSIPLGPTARDELPDNAYGQYMRFCLEFLGAEHYTEHDYRLMGKHYYGEMALIDEQVGRIVEAVERAGIADNTWIFFSSDHGELLGDHGMITKAVFYESSVRVPALVVPPRGASVAAREAQELVQGIDIPATILDVGGADLTGLSGRSLLGGGKSPAREAVFSQIAAFTMVATRGLKLVVETATLEPQALYDLHRDPAELVDLRSDPAYAGIIRQLIEGHVRPYIALTY